MNTKLTVVGLSALLAGALVLVAAGPVGLALVVMGVPFVLLVLLTRGAGHAHEDNGHFRAPHA